MWLKNVDGCTAALHLLDVYCKEQSNWEQNTEAAITSFIPVPVLIQLENIVCFLWNPQYGSPIQLCMFVRK